MPALTWDAAAVRALRKALGENVATFAAKVGRAARTVETWEQGTRTPDPLVQRILTARARRLIRTKKETTT